MNTHVVFSLSKVLGSRLEAVYGVIPYTFLNLYLNVNSDASNDSPIVRMLDHVLLVEVSCLLSLSHSSPLSLRSHSLPISLPYMYLLPIPMFCMYPLPFSLIVICATHFSFTPCCISQPRFAVCVHTNVTSKLCNVNLSVGTLTAGLLSNPDQICLTAVSQCLYVTTTPYGPVTSVALAHTRNIRWASTLNTAV